ncbi:MAG: IS4 family transposase [Verrucomicrobiae bacterium]|nr:IS4 family transposase [Verrucomicrobiae bacterium]
MHTPFLPAFRSRLAALGRRAAHSLRQATLGQLQDQLRDLLPAPLLSSEAEGLNSRERDFPLRLTFECFLWQRLNPRTACREVVRQVQALRTLHGWSPISESASAYIQARLRLPKERLEKALAATAQTAERRAAPSPQLQGRPVKVVDGSSTPVADTPANQLHYPQPRSQKPGCGFPVMKLVVIFSLCGGAVLNVLLGNQHHHDLRLLRGLWDQLQQGDILPGDRAYGEYTTLAGLPQQGVDVVARLHQRRKVDFRKARRLGKNDGLLVWTKGYQQSEILSANEWDLLPVQITVRILRFTTVIRGFCNRRITLVTSLLDPELYPAEELVALYAGRWRLELCRRDLKTTLGMEQLRCKTPDMAEKELLAYLVAHNLVRCVMAEAVVTHQVELDRVSFKGSLDALRQFSDAISRAPHCKLRRQLWEDLLLALARDLVPRRPNRTKPRAVKRRPKPFPLLNKPRRKFVEISHRSRYWKGRPRNYRGLN